jgi:hypothetical protein
MFPRISNPADDAALFGPVQTVVIPLVFVAIRKKTQVSWELVDMEMFGIRPFGITGPILVPDRVPIPMPVGNFQGDTR